MFGQKLSDILRAVAGSLETPVVLVLLVLIAAALALLGSLIVEFFMEHRHLKVCLPQLADKLRAAKPGELAGCIERSGLLRRQKRADGASQPPGADRGYARVARPGRRRLLAGVGLCGNLSKRHTLIDSDADNAAVLQCEMRMFGHRRILHSMRFPLLQMASRH